MNKFLLTLALFIGLALSGLISSGLSQTGGGTVGGNPPFQLRRGSSILQLDSNGNVDFFLPAGKAAIFRNTCTGAAVSASGQANLCYNGTSFQVSLNGGAYSALVTLTTPGGNNTQLQYNNAGAFGGITGATTDGSVVTLLNPLFSTTATLSNNNILNVSSDGFVLQNTTTASVGNTQQFSPRLRLTAHGWTTASGGNDKQYDWIVENQPLSNAVGSSNLVLSRQIAGGGYVAEFTLTSAGNLTVPGVLAGSNLVTATGKILTVNNTLTFAGTDGSTLNVGAGGTLGSNAFNSTTIPTANATTGTIPYLSAAGVFLDSPLFRVDANTIRQANTTTAQKFELYSTTDSNSSPVNYERLTTTINSGNFLIKTENGGTGTNRELQFQGNGIRLYPLGTSTATLLINNSGHFQFITDNTYDIGLSGASRPRTGYFGTSVIAPTANFTTYQAGGTTIFSSGTPSITGNATLNTGSKDSSGKITSTGTGASTAVITFSITFTRAPACFVTNETTSNLVRPISTTTTLTISATVVTGDSLSYICLGY